ncbi:MAG TPA: rod shape-determining protein [Thermoleophilaceae bacterium]|nr:rod shape-determining protein [Thermoleophilaceae bacterium]
MFGGGGGRDIAIDLGTANTLVFERGRGIALSEPSVVAVDAESGSVQAVGDDARRMIGRTPATISAIRPLRHGVIADFEVTERMLRYFIRSVHPRPYPRSRVVMCAPSGVTEVEKRAVEEACLAAGARKVQLIEEPIAAAIGAGLPIGEPSGNMVVDIGGGTSEVAVIALGGMIVSESLRVGGYDFDDAIATHLKRAHGIVVGQQTAEKLKLDIGSATALAQELETEVRGRDVATGLPKTLTLTSQELRAACAEPLAAVIEAVKTTLEQTPPELAADISTRGILLAGGGALLRGFDTLLHDATELPVRLAESPLTCVVLGAGQALEEFDAMEELDGRPTRRRSPRPRRASFARSGRSRRR